ncbi:hypothetical protein VTP01DRAFT_5833 [Rhizomucor pusillus]|uniref:uncharacterized protein n=1 Tax=Rhizomucor pusillus TaxID=4840 RepID=UPI0037435250
MELMRGKISHFAYDRIIEQLVNAWSTDYEACQCPARVQFRLSCYHVLPRDSSPVTLDMIDPRWILDEELAVKYTRVDTTSTNEFGDDQNAETLETETEQSRLSLISEGIKLLSSLDDKLEQGTNQERMQLISILDVEDARLEIKPPVPAQSLKGRSPTKRTKPTFEIYDEKVRKKAKQLKKTHDQWPLLSPAIPKNQVVQVFGPQRDGNCGFRCLAYALKRVDGEDSYQEVKEEMYQYLDSKKERYLQVGVFLHEAIDRLVIVLKEKGNAPNHSTDSMPLTVHRFEEDILIPASTPYRRVCSEHGINNQSPARSNPLVRDNFREDCTHEAKRINWHPFQTLVALHFSHLQDNNRIRPMYLTLVYNRCAIANVTHKVATTNKRVPFAVHISYDKYTLNLQCLKYAIPTDPEDPLVISDVKTNVRPFTFRKYLNSPPTSSENSTSYDQL